MRGLVSSIFEYIHGHNEAYYAELAGMEREYKMAEKEAKMREPIMSGLTAVEAAQLLHREVYEKQALGETVDTRLVRSLEKLGVIKFKKEQITTYEGVDIKEISDRNLIYFLKMRSGIDKANHALLNEIERRLKSLERN